MIRDPHPTARQTAYRLHHYETLVSRRFLGCHNKIPDEKATKRQRAGCCRLMTVTVRYRRCSPVRSRQWIPRRTGLTLWISHICEASKDGQHLKHTNYSPVCEYQRSSLDAAGSSQDKSHTNVTIKQRSSPAKTRVQSSNRFRWHGEKDLWSLGVCGRPWVGYTVISICKRDSILILDARARPLFDFGGGLYGGQSAASEVGHLAG
jgi:hypothetical protein